MDIYSQVIGYAGELRIRSELLLRGFSPAVFDYDDGADIILKNGKKIQVKTSINPIYSKKDYSWRYSFSIRQPQVRPSGNGKYERKYTKRSYQGIVDFFIFWCVKDNFFYIVPEHEVSQKVSFSISKTGRTYGSKYDQYKNNWDVLKG